MAKLGVALPQYTTRAVSDSAKYAQTIAEVYLPKPITQFAHESIVPLVRQRTESAKTHVKEYANDWIDWANTEGRARAPPNVITVVEQTVQQLDGVRTEVRHLAERSQTFVEASLQDPTKVAHQLASSTITKADASFPPKVLEIAGVLSDMVLSWIKNARSKGATIREGVMVQYKVSVDYFNQVRVHLNSHVENVFEYIRRMSKNLYVMRAVEFIDEVAVRYMPIGLASWTRRSLPRHVNGRDTDLEREHQQELSNGALVDVDGSMPSNGDVKRKKKKKH